MKLLVKTMTACLLLGSQLASAQTGVSTLDKIRNSGSVTIGHRESSIPFSYVTSAGAEPIGFANDICLVVVDAIKKQLALPQLSVKYQSVTSQNRIPLPTPWLASSRSLSVPTTSWWVCGPPLKRTQALTA